jgi:small subunit ribosomal protein S9
MSADVPPTQTESPNQPAAQPGHVPQAAGQPFPAIQNLSESPAGSEAGATVSAPATAATTLAPAVDPGGGEPRPATATIAQPAASGPAKDALGTGRRKTSVARVRLRPGTGQIRINSRELKDYFPNLQDQLQVLAPLERTQQAGKVDVIIRVHGGGPTGQSGACKLGIARALKVYDPQLEPILREANLLTRDARMKERKKYGLRGARRGTQFSKR